MQTCYIRKKWHGQKTVDLFFQPWSPHGATSTLTPNEEDASLTFVWATSGRRKARMGRPKPNECTQWRAYGLDPPAPPRGNRTPGKGISDALRSCQILLPSYIQRKQTVHTSAFVSLRVWAYVYWGQKDLGALRPSLGKDQKKIPFTDIQNPVTVMLYTRSICRGFSQFESIGVLPAWALLTTLSHLPCQISSL